MMLVNTSHVSVLGETSNTGESSITKQFVSLNTLLQKPCVIENLVAKINFTLQCFLCCQGGLYFLTRIFNFFVSTFWRPELFVPRRFIAGTFWRCNIQPPKKKNLPLLYETRAAFSCELCCRKFCYRRLTCTKKCILKSLQTIK